MLFAADLAEVVSTRGMRFPRGILSADAYTVPEDPVRAEPDRFEGKFHIPLASVNITRDSVKYIDYTSSLVHVY